MSAGAPTIAIIGARGRVGQRLVALAPELGLEVLWSVTSEGPPLDARPAPLPELLIDFSLPGQVDATLTFAATHGLPCVLGTTGLCPAQESHVKAASRTAPLLQASNFSIGIAALSHLVEETARRLGPGWDIEIVETHHRMKIDAPSGTALTLAEAAAAGRSWHTDEVLAHGRCGQTGARPEAQIGMHALRGGTVVGEHTVHFHGPGESIALEHRARDRDVFARGALRAGLWLLGLTGQARPGPGLYGMADVLGLRR